MPSSSPLDQFIASRVKARFAAKDTEEKDKKKLLMAIYKRMPIGNKHLRGGKHTIMFSGSSAKEYGVDNYTSVVLEELSMEELKKAAKAVGA